MTEWANVVDLAGRVAVADARSWSYERRASVARTEAFASYSLKQSGWWAEERNKMRAELLRTWSGSDSVVDAMAARAKRLVGTGDELVALLAVAATETGAKTILAKYGEGSAEAESAEEVRRLGALQADYLAGR